ncbi:hypothetical protein [Luteimonas fraxinea]|nr:hypothetical protein [Luteimonas fraxinea]
MRHAYATSDDLRSLPDDTAPAQASSDETSSRVIAPKPFLAGAALP